MSLSVFKRFALLALLMVSFSFFTSCSNDEAQVKSTAQNLEKAMKKGDIDAMLKYVSKKDVEMMQTQLKEMTKEQKNEMAEMIKEMAEGDVTYGKVTIDGEKATMEVTTKMKDGKKEEDEAEFIKEDGKWKMKLES